MKVKFIYAGSNSKNGNIEKFCQKVIELMKQIYPLPETIEIQFENLGANVYGMTLLDPRLSNRIRLNRNLSLEELVLPLTHELLHLHQMFTNKLQTRTGGRILWQNVPYKVDMLKISYQEYQQLPWELDVEQKQKKLLEFLQQNKRKIKV